MNKYMILALLPIIFQGNMYCEDKIDDINRMIQPQLISARAVMRGELQLKLDLDIILKALLAFAQKNAGTASEAVERMKAIKGALAEYREEEQSGSRTFWDKVLFKNAKKVIEEIDPAIDKVNNALKDLEAFCANSSNSAYKAVGITAGVVGALTIAGIALWWVTSEKEQPKKEMPAFYTREDVADHWATIIGYNFGSPGEPKYIIAYVTAYKSVQETAAKDPIFNHTMYDDKAKAECLNTAYDAAKAAVDAAALAANE